MFIQCFTTYNFSECSMERDNFMSPFEAKDFGIIDKVLTHPMQEEDIESTKLTKPALEITTQP